MESVCELVEFLTKLVALLPPPSEHLTRYHCVFAPSHAWRSRSVSALLDSNTLGRDSLPLADEHGTVASSSTLVPGGEDKVEASSTCQSPPAPWPNGSTGRR